MRKIACSFQKLHNIVGGKIQTKINHHKITPDSLKGSRQYVTTKKSISTSYRAVLRKIVACVATLFKQSTSPAAPFKQATSPAAPIRHGTSPAAPFKQATSPAASIRHGTSLAAAFKQATNPAVSITQTTNIATLFKQARNPAAPIRHGTSLETPFKHATNLVIPFKHVTSVAILFIFSIFLSACSVSLGGIGDSTAKKELYVGFAQVGHESDWRFAETKSVKEALSEENGIRLEFVDCDNDIEVQRSAINDFIEKGVDYIIIAPIISTGWDDILAKAEEANIPVIVIDRTIDDSDNYATWLGSEFTDEGLAAGEWLKAYTAAKGLKEINIVEITGNEGSSAENGRTAGFHKYIEYEGWNIIDSRDGEFTEEGGKRIMDFFCDEYEGQFNIVVSQNDNMSFGIMQSLDEHGISYGVDGDVIIVSFDACTSGLRKVLEGSINADFQCNPLQGADCLKLIRDLEAGKAVERETFMSETWYAAEDLVTEITYFNSLGELVTEPIVVVDQNAVDEAY